MSKAASADLILKLYDLRREEKMREARNWFVGFFPESADEIIRTIIDPEYSARYRMVTSYWDMAASFVNHGAIDEEMFFDTGGEGITVFAKIEPYLDGVREAIQNPDYLKNLEKLMMKQPAAKATLAKRREAMKRMLEARAEMAQSA